MASKKILAIVSKPELAILNSVQSKSTMVQMQKRYRSMGAIHRPSQQDLERGEHHRAMEKSFTRDWNGGDVYAPHDLTGAEARKWKAKKAPTTDVFDSLSLNPLDCYKNFSIMSEYITDLGRIRPRSQTGLRNVNQRKLAKAIRRAQGIGLLPSVYRHPEILKHEIRDNSRVGQ